jgi:hypothetical protein
MKTKGVARKSEFASIAKMLVVAIDSNYHKQAFLLVF